MCVLPAVKRAAEHSTDDSVHACIEAIERWVNGDDSVNLLAAANDAKLSEAELASPAEWAAAAANDLAMAALDGDVAWMDDAPHSAVIAASVKAADDPRAAQAEKDERASQVRDIIAVYPPTRKHEWRL